jgi:hypothetical protein
MLADAGLAVRSRLGGAATGVFVVIAVRDKRFTGLADGDCFGTIFSRCSGVFFKIRAVLLDAELPESRVVVELVGRSGFDTVPVNRTLRSVAAGAETARVWDPSHLSTVTAGARCLLACPIHLAVPEVTAGAGAA